jgi:hypothetical protein
LKKIKQTALKGQVDESNWHLPWSSTPMTQLMKCCQPDHGGTANVCRQP